MNTSKEAWMEVIQAGDVLLQEMLNPTLRSQISAPPMPVGVVTHWQHPFAPLPTTCTPEMMSLLHPRCLRMENWSYLSLSCNPRAQGHPCKGGARGTHGAAEFYSPHFWQSGGKVLPISLLKAAIMGSPALQLAIKHLIGEVFWETSALGVFGLIKPVTVHSALPNCRPINFPLH